MKYLCPHCYQKVDVKYLKRRKEKCIRNEIFEYWIKEGVCCECGEVVPVKELEDEKDLLITQMYCRKYNLITIEEIHKIIRVYNVDKRQLPFIIDVGEHTIERYLKGQIPNENISRKLKSYLENYHNFLKKYEDNKNHIKITDATKKKVHIALQQIDKTNSCETKIEAVALYIINSGYEITNLALQKLLYYCDAVSLRKIGRAMFLTECEAWIHGPVYPLIYNKYKSFDGEPISDCDLNKEYLERLTDQDRTMIDYVLKNFAIYNGKVLEKCTHLETPWIKQRIGYLPEEASNEIIDKKSIEAYFKNIEKEFDILNSDHVQKYVGRAMN